MTDSSSLAEEMAVHKDAEERRRRKWLKPIKDYLSEDAVDTKTLGIEVNVKNNEQPWPALTRADVESYVASLKEMGAFDAAVKEMEESVKLLDVPSKQLRNANAKFKNGSIHGLAYGRNSLLMRGDDELIQTMQSDKLRLEDRLKGSESRVRKLEDLLHRSTQVPRPITSRPSSSGLDRFSTSPVLPQAAMISQKPSETELRRPSLALASRPVSATFGVNDKALLQKLVQLEGELEAEKAKTARMEEGASRDAQAQDELRQQFNDATSTKKDLMDNFEAQQLEFVNERRLIQDDNRNLKIRLEEMEEELDRVLGSHEKTKSDLEKREASFDKKLASLRDESELEQQQTRLLEDKMKEQETVISDLMLDQQNRDERDAEAQKSLQSMHNRLAHSDLAPEHFGSLVAAVEMLSHQATDHQRELQIALDAARTQNRMADERFEGQLAELTDLQGLLRKEQSTAHDLRQALSTEKGRFQSLHEELDDHRSELANLRARFADDSTGPDALKSRLAAEEHKVERLHLDLASARSMADQSEQELSNLREQIASLESVHNAASAQLQGRGERASQVTLHLFSLVDRLKRVLENIGYSVLRQDDTMIVQRVPRASNMAASTTADASQPPSAVTPAPLLSTPDLAPPTYLHWALAADAEAEHDDFNAFMHETQAFDLDVFAESVVKRVKDMEHIARKWQREARSYREKVHRAQQDAQQRIAFRGFRTGDLALFLPTRNQTPARAWAAFNVGAPHYFLREQEGHRLKAREFLLARIANVEERVVDLGQGLSTSPSTRGPARVRSGDDAAVDEHNPFGLSDGLRWYLLDAAEDTTKAEEKLGAPTGPGVGAATVASARVDAAGSVLGHARGADDVGPGAATRVLAKSLDSRRSSAASRKSLVGGVPIAQSLSPNPSNLNPEASTSSSPAKSGGEGTPSNGEEATRKPLPADRTAIPEEEGRQDQMLDP